MAARRVRVRRAAIAPWNAYPDQRERECWNRWKLAYSRARPLDKRCKAYYKRVRAAYLAQAHGTLDPWLTLPADSNGEGGFDLRSNASLRLADSSA